jgi:hypothetical protein
MEIGLVEGGEKMSEQSFKQETIKMVAKRKTEIADKWEQECLRLLKSGAIDPEDHSRGTLFGVALENMADNYLRGERQKSDYKNMKKF